MSIIVEREIIGLTQSRRTESYWVRNTLVDVATDVRVAEAAQDGMVLMVHLDGFMVGGKVVQASQVVIGKHTPAPPPAPPEIVVEAEAAPTEAEPADEGAAEA